jgi:dTDP-4-dehydrorhamnose reductase
MNVLICGASGITGRELATLLTKKQIPWTGTYNTNPFPNGRNVDFTNAEQVERLFQEIKPTHCINSIVERNVETCEKNWDQTKRLNIDVPHLLAELCKKYNVYFVHISTDYVFDGLKGPFSPTSQPNPLQNYGISKLIAEYRVKTTFPCACIVRVPVLYSASITQLSESAVTILGKKVMDPLTPCSEDDYFLRRPVFIADVCEYLLDCMQTKREGTYHFYNPRDRFTKYQIQRVIAGILQKPVHHITPNSQKPLYLAGRPYDTHLTDLSYDRSQYSFTDLQTGLEKVFAAYAHEPLSLCRKPTQSILFLIDLDGTLVDTDKVHYEAYTKVLQEKKLELPWETYESLSNVDDYLQSHLTANDFKDVKEKKRNEMLKLLSIQMMPGADVLLDYLERFSINYIVVTNTSMSTIRHFQSICPPLQKVQQWIAREDVTLPKPNGQCYQKAIEVFGKGEDCIVGIENTASGYEALRCVTSKLYVLTHPKSYTHKTLQAKDCYFISSLTDLFTNVATYSA